MLVDNFKENCVLLEKTRKPDGEGGWITTWADTVTFKAAIVRDQSMQARIAEKQGVKNVYTVTTSINAQLDYHDVFRRVRDGQVFRVTSNGDDKRTPEVSTLKLEQVSAEEWVLA